MPKIAVFEVDENEENALKSRLFINDIEYVREPLSIQNIVNKSDCEIIIIFIHSKIDKSILTKLPKLKFISTMSTGVDHIDTELCRKKGIVISNVPGYGEITVAEHTLALILAISRKIVESVEQTRRGDFTNIGLCGFDLNGKTLGIIGTGKIGIHVVRLSHSFGMKIIAFSKHKNNEIEKMYDVEYVETIDELLRRSDVLTLHTSLTDETFHLINMKNIYKIKKGSILINTARGALIETSALLKALDDGILSYAGIDVLEEECAIKEEKELLSETFMEKCDLKTVLANHILLKHKHVIVTPHNGFNSVEALDTINHITAENISCFLKGKPQNMVL